MDLLLFFDKAFLQNFSILFLSLLLGIPFALKTNRIIEKRAKKSDKIALSQALLITFVRNLTIIEKISPKIGTPEMIEERLDLSVLDNVAQYKYNMLNISTCMSIEDATYHLRWYAYKLEILQTWIIEHLPDTESSPDLPYRLDFIRGSLAGHRGVVEDKINLATSKLKTELKWLGKGDWTSANGIEL